MCKTLVPTAHACDWRCMKSCKVCARCKNKVLAQVIKDPPPLLQKDINQADIKKNETATIVETLATEQIGANSKYNWPQEPALSFVKQSQPAPNIAQQKTNATKPKPRAPEAKSLTTKANTHDKDSNSKLQTASIIATADNTKSDVEQSKIKASAPLAKDEFRFPF